MDSLQWLSTRQKWDWFEADAHAAVNAELLPLAVSVVELEDLDHGAFRQAIGQGIAAGVGADWEGVTYAMRLNADHTPSVSMERISSPWQQGKASPMAITVSPSAISVFILWEVRWEVLRCPWRFWASGPGCGLPSSGRADEQHGHDQGHGDPEGQYGQNQADAREDLFCLHNHYPGRVKLETFNLPVMPVDSPFHWTL